MVGLDMRFQFFIGTGADTISKEPSTVGGPLDIFMSFLVRGDWRIYGLNMP